MNDAHERSRFARRQPLEIDSLRVFVPTAEDVVVRKLRWFTRLTKAVAPSSGDEMLSPYVGSRCVE